MVDFTAKPIPEGLLQAYIKAKSDTPFSSAVTGATTGLTKGLALTEEIDKQQKARRVREEVQQVKQDPDFKVADKDMSGMLSPVFDLDPAKGMEIWANYKKKKTEDFEMWKKKQDYANELKGKYADKTATKDYINTRVDDLRAELAVLAPYGERFISEANKEAYELKKMEYDIVLNRQRELGGLPEPKKEKKIRVKSKETGQIGTIPESKFDGTRYEKVKE